MSEWHLHYEDEDDGQAFVGRELVAEAVRGCVEDGVKMALEHRTPEGKSLAELVIATARHGVGEELRAALGEVAFASLLGMVGGGASYLAYLAVKCVLSASQEARLHEQFSRLEERVSELSARIDGAFDAQLLACIEEASQALEGLNRRRPSEAERGVFIARLAAASMSLKTIALNATLPTSTRFAAAAMSGFAWLGVPGGLVTAAQSFELCRPYARARMAALSTARQAASAAAKHVESLAESVRQQQDKALRIPLESSYIDLELVQHVPSFFYGPFLVRIPSVEKRVIYNACVLTRPRDEFIREHVDPLRGELECARATAAILKTDFERLERATGPVPAFCLMAPLLLREQTERSGL
ncbi:hypothetical protein OAX78_01210 [Planctomycetota bacterium]|nr:hypothetical protein [Planctomycetota bacterium]